MKTYTVEIWGKFIARYEIESKKKEHAIDKVLNILYSIKEIDFEQIDIDAHTDEE